MSIIICPGFHSLELTEQFLVSLSLPTNYSVFPTQDYPPYSAIDIYHYLSQQYPKDTPIVFIAFSAGVVGAIGAAIAWQLSGGKVKALIAIDGWGVPLFANFPIYRLSHDYFTHYSSRLFGGGQESFYADPPVTHLDLWRSPATTTGWWVNAPGCKYRCCAQEFLTELLKITNK